MFDSDTETKITKFRFYFDVSKFHFALSINFARIDYYKILFIFELLNGGQLYI